MMHDDHDFVKQNKYNQTHSSYHTIHISYHKIIYSQIQAFPSPEDVTGGEEKATDYIYLIQQCLQKTITQTCPSTTFIPKPNTTCIYVFSITTVIIVIIPQCLSSRGDYQRRKLLTGRGGSSSSPRSLTSV